MGFILSTKSEKFKDNENTRWRNVWLANVEECLAC